MALLGATTPGAGEFASAGLVGIVPAGVVPTVVGCGFEESGLGGGGAWSTGSVRIGVGAAGAYFARPHVTRGSVPATNAIMTGRTQPPPAFKSTGTTTTLSGTRKSAAEVPARASAMEAVQIGSATREPISCRPRLYGPVVSHPTPVARRGVYPMNHALE